MQEWLNYWNFIFWFLLIGFLYNHTNFIMLLLFSEVTWVVLYTLTLFLGILNNDINLISITFLMLGIAGLEFCLGFLLLILFKITNQSFFLTKSQNLNKNIYVNTLNKLILNQVNY